MASTYLSLRVHIVFATRKRAPSIASEWRSDLHAYLGGTIRGLGAYPIAVGGTADHVHVLTGLRATHCLADFVRELKKSSQAWASQHWTDFRWQEGYAGFSISPSDLPSLVQYIQNQEAHHAKETSQDELRRILDEFQIQYDNRFFE